jgi:hypothetical protein
LLLLLAPAVPIQAQALDTPQAVLKAHIQATGGEVAWGRVHTLRMEGTSQASGRTGGGGKFKDVWKFPGYRRTENEGAMMVSSDGGEQTFRVVMITTPEAAWAETPMGRQPLPAADPLVMQAAKPEQILLQDPAYTLLGVEQSTLHEKSVYTVRYEHAGRTLRRYYDRTTLYLVAAEQTIEGQILTTWYDDYRRVGDVLLPHHIKRQTLMQTISTDSGDTGSRLQVGTDTIVQTLARIDVNPTLDDQLFR